jgi:hypothetical protein
MAMTITNPHEAVTIASIRVVWNSLSGANGGPLNLTRGDFEGATPGTDVQFWSGNNGTGDIIITPSSPVTIPGNNLTSAIIFTFNNNYHPRHLGTQMLSITLSTPGCEGITIQAP